MARAVVFTNPVAPSAAPPHAIFEELRRHGEELQIYSSAQYRAAATGPAGSSVGPLNSLLRRLAFAEQILPELLEALRANRPDYLLLDSAAIWGPVASTMLDVPAISWRSTCVVDREMLAASDWPQRLLDAAPPDYLALARRLDRRYGSRTADLAATMECRCDLNLLLLPPTLQPAAERLDTSYQFVCLASDDPSPSGAFPWNRLGPDPLIYIALETLPGRASDFFHACAGAFGGLPLEVVLTFDGGAEPPGLAPPNFHLFPSVPQTKLLERTTLTIAAADGAIVERCARAGVLQLLYAEDVEQFFLAARIQGIGAGRRLEESDLTGPRLRNLAGHVMAAPAYCLAAESLRQSLRQTGANPAAEACAAILGFTRRGSRHAL